MSIDPIATSGNVGTLVMVELCRIVLDGLGMSAERTLSLVVPIFKGEGDIRNCS